MKFSLKILIAIFILCSCNKNRFEPQDGSLTAARAVQPAQVSRTVWEFNQRTESGAEKSRLMLSLPTADYDPVGLRKKGNTTLVVKVTTLSGTALPKLIVGTYGRDAVSVHDLVVGNNTITTVDAGDLYVKFSSATPNSANKVRVEFISGFDKVAFFQKGKTLNQTWKNMLRDDTVKSAILVGTHAFIVVARDSALKFQDKNQDSILYFVDKAMEAEHAISGLDGSTPANKTWDGKLLISQVRFGYMSAGNDGRIYFTDDLAYRILDHTQFRTKGWGLFHEMGHHHQMGSWTFSQFGEVNPNIYTIAANRSINPSYVWTNQTKWSKVQTFFGRHDSIRIVNSSSTDGDVKLNLYVQLRLAFGDIFYQTLHKLVRTERPVASGDPAEMRLFMLYASRASGKDLSNVFRKYGFNVDQSVYNEIAALNLPKPSVDVTSLVEGTVTEGAVFYENYDFGGKYSKYLAKGNYTQAQLSANGISNNWVSSVHVPAGWKITLYDGDNFTGTSWVLTSSNGKLGNLSPGANDKLSSLKIE